MGAPRAGGGGVLRGGVAPGGEGLGARPGPDAAPRDADWPRWLDAAAVPDLVPKSWQDYANSTHAMEAATAGLGIAMAHAPFAADSLAAGRLVKPFATECDDTDGDYYVVHRSADVPRRVRQFRDWLLGQRDDASSRVSEF